MITNVLIIDTETTGLDPSKEKMIEIAAILFNVKTKTILQSFSSLLPCDVNNAFDINHIPAESTRAPMVMLGTFMATLLEMATAAQALVAHNARFDIGFLKRYMPSLLVRPVICTKSDFKWPMLLYRMRLQDICQASEVSYVNAHRALADCNLIAECFKKVPDLEARLKTALKFKSDNSFIKDDMAIDRNHTFL